MIKNQEDLNQAIEEGSAKFNPVMVPNYYATAIHVTGTSNGMTITFSRARPALIEGSNETVFVQFNEPQFVLDLAPGTAKDLLIALDQTLKTHESQYGEVVTDFSRMMGAQREQL